MKLIIYACGLVVMSTFFTVRCADNASDTISVELIQEIQRRIQEQEKQQKELLAQMARLMTNDESGKKRDSITPEDAAAIEKLLADHLKELVEHKKISHVRSSSI